MYSTQETVRVNLISTNIQFLSSFPFRPHGFPPKYAVFPQDFPRFPQNFPKMLSKYPNRGTPIYQKDIMSFVFESAVPGLQFDILEPYKRFILFGVFLGRCGRIGEESHRRLRLDWGLRDEFHRQIYPAFSQLPVVSRLYYCSCIYNKQPYTESITVLYKLHIEFEYTLNKYAPRMSHSQILPVESICFEPVIRSQLL